jgi:hypothetical protein
VRARLKDSSLLACLFLFLLVVLGGGLHLNPVGAFVAAVTGTPLLIAAFNRLRPIPRVARPHTVQNQSNRAKMRDLVAH